MNPHYHPYAELSSPHPPSPDNNNYPSHGHHNGHGPAMNLIEGHHQGFHQMNNNHLMKHCAGCSGKYFISYLSHTENSLIINIFISFPGKISERYYLQALDRFWHNSCLKCTCCHIMLAELGNSCFTKPGMILCKSDYYR